jgi:hypothetical protein
MNQKSKKTAKPNGAKKKQETQASTAPPSFMVEWERTGKQFHEEIDDAMGQAYKCHPGCQGFGRCRWSMRVLHVLDLKQAIKNVTQVVRRFCSVSRPRGQRQTEIVRKALQIKSENKGRTCRQILAAERPDWDKLNPDEQEVEVIKLRANLRQARKRTKVRDLKKRGE